MKSFLRYCELLFLNELWRFPSPWSDAESLSPAGSHNYSSSGLTADRRAIFRFPKMTSPVIGSHTYCLLGPQHLGLAKTSHMCGQWLFIAGGPQLSSTGAARWWLMEDGWHQYDTTMNDEQPGSARWWTVRALTVALAQKGFLSSTGRFWELCSGVCVEGLCSIQQVQVISYWSTLMWLKFPLLPGEDRPWNRSWKTPQDIIVRLVIISAAHNTKAQAAPAAL